MTEARMHDGNALELEIQGKGPFLLIPVNPTPVEGEAAEEMRRWGADPALGRSLMEGLMDIATLLVGLQLAIRTDRLTALVMGGFPPLSGPYDEMLDVTSATHRMASEPSSAPPISEAGGI
jgi:hypothetical protein